ncbi:hypothetical protein EON62_06325 [archaeon]|nr:MAG: hypothetical protein EON62_06325 [archaeon]
MVRGKDGFAIECADGEAGELISKLNPSDKTGLLTFKGYEGAPAANESKIARNVFVKGDMYFRSGDLLRRSAAGGFYFVDRVGDTFRWHGENVAASEVADVLHGWPSLQDIIVRSSTLRRVRTRDARMTRRLRCATTPLCTLHDSSC